MNAEYEAYKTEMLAEETKYLGQRRCPWSGMPLDQLYTPDAFGRNTLACLVCDCFGYDPDDIRLGSLEGS